MNTVESCVLHIGIYKCICLFVYLCIFCVFCRSSSGAKGKELLSKLTDVTVTEAENRIGNRISFGFWNRR